MRTTSHTRKQKLRLLFSSLFLSLFLLNILSVLFPVLLQARVSAAPSLEVTYLNFGVVQVKHGYTGDKLVADQRYELTTSDGESYQNYPGKRKEREFKFTPAGDKAGNDSSGKNCVSSVVLRGANADGLPNNSTATVYLKQGDGRGSERCSVIKREVTVRNFKAGSETLFNWKNADVMNPVSVLPYIHEKGGVDLDEIRYQGYGAFVKQPNGEFVNIDNGDACKSYVNKVSVNAAANTTRAEVHLWNRDGGDNCSKQFNSNFPVNVGNTQNQKTPSNGDLSGGVEVGEAKDSSGNEDGGPALVCDVDFNPLNWLLCGAVKGMVKIVGTLDKLINSLLSVGTEGSSANPSQIFGVAEGDTYNLDDATSAGKDSTSTGFYKAWATVRNISLGLMVLVGLTIIIAQALGNELVDAYTLRKALPRFIIAAIAITLSWQLLQFLVTITNQLGLGIRFLIYQPFDGVVNDLGDAAGPVGGIGVYLIGLGALGALGIFGLLSFAGTAALALFVAFLILVLRQIIIIVLIIFAPIAIAAYVLPNTQNFYKLWWESLEKALLMFPIIAAMIASGRVFSAVALSGNPNAIEQLIGFAAYFAPYFAIPFALKFAGGALRTLGGMANDINRGGFDRLKKYRGATMAKRGQAFKAGSLYQDRGLGKIVNNAGRRAAVGTRGRFGIGGTGRAALATATMAGNEEALRNNPALRQLQNNDDANNVLGLSGGSERGAVAAANELFGDDENRKKNALDAARAVGFTRQNAAAAFETSSKNKWRAVGAGRYDALQNGINRLSGGNSSEAAGMQYAAQYFNRESGRGDLGGNWMSGDLQTKAASFAQQAYGNADTSTVEGKENVRKAMSDLTAMDGMGRTSVQAMSNGYTAQVKQNASTLTTMLKHGNTEQKSLAATRMLEMQKALPYTSGDNQAVINKMLSDVGIKYEDTSMSVDQQLAALSLGSTDSTGRPVLTNDVLTAATQLSRGARTYDQDPNKIGQDNVISQG